MKEKLSALIDSELGELDERRVLNALRDDVELRRAWERYHLIRSAATGQPGALLAAGFAERVLARLEAEGHDARPALRLWPLAGGFAAAAFVAAVAFLGVQMVRTSNDAAAPLAVAPAANEISPASVNTATATASAADVATVAASAVEAPAAAVPKEMSGERLSIYLVGHSEVMPTTGMGSMFPYVRVVTHGPDGDTPSR